MLTGMTENLPADVIIESGVVFKGTTPVGVTMGGIKFDPGKTVRNIEYDNKRSDVQGLDRIITYKPKLSFKLIEFGGSTTGNQIALVEEGSTTVETGHPSTLKGSIKTTTPKAAGAFFATGDYAADLRVIFERGGGGYAAVYFPIGFCDKYDLQGKPNNEGEIAAEFSARLSQSDAKSSPGKCPYVIELRTALPS